MRIKFISSIAVFITLAITAFSQVKPDCETVSAEALMQTVRILSSPTFAGRLPGHEGYDEAAKSMADGFAHAGLKPAFDRGFFQHLEVECNAILPPCSFEVITDNQTIIRPTLGKDFTFRGFGGSGDFVAPVAFAGYGISSPEQVYNDFERIDVKGKVAMVFRTNPAWSASVENGWPEATPRKKAEMAARHGAIGILLVSPPGDRENLPEVIGSVMHGTGMQRNNFPQLVIGRELADMILQGSGQTLRQLHGQMESNQKPGSMILKSQIRISVNTQYQEKAKTVNVVGLLQGSDPVLRDEYLVLGAHLDHVGSQCNEIYFPGANDNASGCAAVLEIARVFQTNGIQPKRSVLFVLFASEEQGLHGAEHFVSELANGPVSKDKIVAMLNFDCIAHGDSIQLGNGKSVPVLWNLAKANDKKSLVVDRTWSGGGADATPFHNAGIPALYFVSTYSYKHLHSISDTPETLNPELFAAIVNLGLATAIEIAGGKYKGEK